MARAILTAGLIVLLNVFVGCNGNKEDIDMSSAKLMLIREKPAPGSVPLFTVTTEQESDIVEQMVANRQGYRGGLEALKEYYTKEGNNMKLTWVQKELAALDGMPQYNYIVEASIAGPDLKATSSLHAANYLYEDGLRLEKKAKELIVIVDDSKLLQALDRYNELIRMYPTSDKIDDAAYRAADIYEHFHDYTIAVLYYQRAHQWDPQSPYPALYRAAYILDRRLHRYAEALELYQQAIKKEGLFRGYKEFAEMRIAEITRGDEEVE